LRCGWYRVDPDLWLSAWTSRSLVIVNAHHPSLAALIMARKVALKAPSIGASFVPLK
jgi:hypothetical protein